MDVIPGLGGSGIVNMVGGNFLIWCVVAVAVGFNSKAGTCCLSFTYGMGVVSYVV